MSALRRRAAGSALAAVLFACLALTAPAGASEVDGARFRDLAAKAAAGDQRALADLRAVDTVDGVAVAGAGLVGPDDAGRPGRLRTLAAATGGAPADADAARAAAAAILAERPFGAGGAASGQRSIWAAIFDFLGDVASAIFFGAEGSVPLFLLTAVAVLAAAGLLGTTWLRRRAGREQRRRHEAAVAAARPELAADVEAAAERAESQGAYAEAIRLRFRAGLLRLDQRGVLPLDPTMTTGRLQRALRTSDAAAVTRLFDEVVYGGRTATRRDAESAHAGWKAILARRPSG